MSLPVRICSQQLLWQVERMAKQLGVAGDVAYTCETAAHFWLLHVLARWEKFVAAAEATQADDCVQVCGLLALLPLPGCIDSLRCRLHWNAVSDRPFLVPEAGDHMLLL